MTDAARHRTTNTLDLLFFVGFSLLTCHELDAVMQHEWRLLPLISRLSDEDAYPLFVLLHIPLFAVLIWLTGNTNRRLRFVAQLALDAFFVIHSVIHFSLSGGELYTFHSATSEICIFGAGAVGLVHSVLLWRGR